jgi:hypothetical protein
MAGVAWHPPELNPDYPLGAYTDADGKLVVWVNASPDHPRHGGGWFEPHKGKPGAYRPQRPATPDEDGYLDRDQAEAEVSA